VDGMRDAYQRRRDRMLKLVNAIPGLQAQKPAGAFYIFPNVSSFGLSSKEIAVRLLDEAGVAVLAGTDFGPGGEGYIRLVYAVAPGAIETGMGKLAEWFSSL
jgi:aspartate/methionine/tyrosine aminotransferase